MSKLFLTVRLPEGPQMVRYIKMGSTITEVYRWVEGRGWYELPRSDWDAPEPEFAKQAHYGEHIVKTGR